MPHGGNHACRDHPSPFLHRTKTQQVGPKISNLDSSDQSTDFHWSTDWPSVLKVMMDCCFSLLSWLVLAIIWILTVPTWLLHNTTDGPNPIKKKRNSTNESSQGAPDKATFQLQNSWSGLGKTTLSMLTLSWARAWRLVKSHHQWSSDTVIHHGNRGENRKQTFSGGKKVTRLLP